MATKGSPGASRLPYERNGPSSQSVVQFEIDRGWLNLVAGWKLLVWCNRLSFTTHGRKAILTENVPVGTPLCHEVRGFF